MPGVELGHHGAECSFDAIIKKYNLSEPALKKMALIVRGADTAAKDLTPESRGLEAIAAGFQLIYQDDLKQLADEHWAQVINYLKSTGKQLGLLVNFGHYPMLERERFVN